ncbi:MAG: hypothetical protein ABI898_09065 [Sphingomonadales bacterium]
MNGFLALLAAATAQLTIGTIDLRSADFLDGRAIAGGTGTPIVMLTLTPATTSRLAKLGPKPDVQIDGVVTAARITGNTVEIDGQPNFEAARKLALALSGKPPLPDSLDE